MIWAVGLGGCLVHTSSAQRSTSLQWHLPTDPEARVVADACDSAGILVPSIQPMTGWNRPPQLQPSEDAFSGLQILGEAKQVAGEFSAQSTAVGLGAEGSWNRRGHWHVSATRWRLPLGFPLAHEVGRHGTMDGLGQASLLSPSIASVDRLEGAVSWAVSPSIAIRVGQESHHWGQGGRSLFLDRHMAPALGARLWLDAGIVQYTHMLLRTKHLEGDTLQRGWMAAQWAEVSLGGGWSGALFGTVKWSADHDVAFQGRVEPHYLIPFGAFRPREYILGSTDNALVGAQLACQTRLRRGQWFKGYSQVLLDEFKASELFGGESWWANKWGVLVGVSSTSNSGKFAWMAEASAVRPWTYTHKTQPNSYSHLHQPLGHPAGGNFVEGRLWARMTLLDDWTLRMALLRRAQGRSEGSDEGLLSFAAGEMPWRPYTERTEDYGQAWLQGTRTDVFRLELDLAYPVGERYDLPGMEAFVRAWVRLEDQEPPGAWQDPWNANRIELGIRQSRVMDERNW